MKTRSYFVLFSIIFCSAIPSFSASAVYDADLINNESISYDTTATLDVSGMDTLAMQAIYSSATITAPTFDDGRKATGTITVLSTSSLTGAHLAIAGYRLDQGEEWTAVGTASGTAKAISDAIVATPGLNALIVSTWSSNVVYATAAVVGTAANSYVMASNVSSITVSGFSNGAASDIDLTNDTISVDSPPVPVTTGFGAALQVLTGSAPTGLTNGTTYYFIRVPTANNKFKLATTSTGAVAGTAIDITAVTGGGTFKMLPTAFAGTYSFKWQSSNDNSNWTDLPISAVTYASPGTSMWDGDIRYKYLRFNLTAGTGGGLNIRVRGFGKRVAQ